MLVQLNIQITRDIWIFFKLAPVILNEFSNITCSVNLWLRSYSVQILAADLSSFFL